jgi:hypothetical protein
MCIAADIALLPQEVRSSLMCMVLKGKLVLSVGDVGCVQVAKLLHDLDMP